ncbi:MAG: D-sedoheptulose 7-phosphate isomerase [Candidatus Poribacteria bacterium]|nr:D-sedoheptulose 7-phosphate isomerase [Candidatus Poribacteria bacterium]
MIDEILQEHIGVIQRLSSEHSDPIQQLGEKAVETLKTGRTIFFCGNGGSAAECQHLAAEIVGRFVKERNGYPAIALTADTSALTAISNDYGYERVFERQVEALGRPDDLLIGISTSGSSANVLHAMRKAREIGLFTVGLTGKDGGILKDIVDLCISVPSDITAHIQEAHLIIGHIMCSFIDANLSVDETG